MQHPAALPQQPAPHNLVDLLFQGQQQNQSRRDQMLTSSFNEHGQEMQQYIGQNANALQQNNPAL